MKGAAVSGQQSAVSPGEAAAGTIAPASCAAVSRIDEAAQPPLTPSGHQVITPSPHQPPPPLPTDRLEPLHAWGMTARSLSYVYRPSTPEGVFEVFETARSHGRSVALRGAGCSYGDASLNAEQIVLDLSRMNRVLEWDPGTGLIRVEPGVTIRQLWQYAIEDGWWPPVVPGTMFVTLGGAAAMNVHGKNNFRVGPLGEHLLEFELLLPSGEIVRCDREQNADLFHAAIGGFGMLGCFTSLTLRMKRIYSGLISVEAISTGSVAEMIRQFEARLETEDYLVGWIDATAAGRAAGRGLIHAARHLAPGEDPNPAQTLRVLHQELPEEFFGLIPRSWMWRLMRPFVNNAGMRLVNAAKYHAGRQEARRGCHLQSHAAFNFLLDYVPGWKLAYRPIGLIQYQAFVPAAAAAETMDRLMALSREAGLPAYLAVFKRHRPDDFLMSYAVDGYSLALDYRVTPGNRARVWDLAHRLDEVVIAAGGRFYFAKDSTLRRGSAGRFLPPERLEAFLALKRRCDPDHLLQTELYRRVFDP
jgi:decaprenylphospho-beta-D-ribofuranose 2-oxidase